MCASASGGPRKASEHFENRNGSWILSEMFHSWGSGWLDISGRVLFWRPTLNPASCSVDFEWISRQHQACGQHIVALCLLSLNSGSLRYVREGGASSAIRAGKEEVHFDRWESCLENPKEPKTKNPWGQPEEYVLKGQVREWPKRPKTYKMFKILQIKLTKKGEYLSNKTQTLSWNTGKHTCWVSL